MACDTMRTVEFEHRLLGDAALFRERAARMEAASRGRIDRARHIALEHDPLAFALGSGTRRSSARV